VTSRSHFSALIASLLIALLGIFAVYHFNRTLTINVGDLGDGPFVHDFNADEADINYRYRWTTAHSEVVFVGAGSAPPAEVAIRAQGARPQPTSQPVTMSLTLNGIALQPALITASGDLKGYHFTVPSMPFSAPFTLSIDASAFRPSGDARQLGVKVDAVQLSQSTSGLNLPPAWLAFWALAFVTGLFGLFIWSASWLVPALVSLAGTLFVILSLLFNTPYTAAYLPPVAAIVGLGGLLVWQRHRVRRWPELVDALGKTRTASVVMLTAMLLYAIFALWIIPQIDWIGHADYAENAVIARNLVEGRGLTVDYVAQFYKDYPGISHPAETWPLLQPLLIAPFFALFGPATWAAKLPNLFILLALAWAVFVAARALWDARVGLFAGLLTLLHPYFFNSVLYPINDLAFTLLFFVLAWLLWRWLSPYARTEDSVEAPPNRAWLQPALLGALAGLLIWSKPSGASLLVGLAIWAVWTWRRYNLPVSANRRALLVAVGTGALVLFPLVVRNLLAFGLPYFTTESYDSWILRYWPFHEWEDIYKVYTGSELPHPRWIVGGKFGYQNLFDAISTNFGWVWQKGVMSEPGSGDYVFGLLPLSAALVGLVALTRRAANLFGMVGLSLILYSLSVLLYWHFEGRYFQVAVPWLYMLAAWGILWIWDRLREILREGLGRRWGLLFLPVAVAALLWPSLSAIRDQVESDTAPTGFVRDMQWLRDNSTPAGIIMTRDPWELNWYTRRRAVMIPNDDLPTIERTMRQYGVTMLQLGGPVDGVDTSRCPNAVGIRPALDGLYCGQERSDYRLVYHDGDLTIYRLVGAK
jgi:hypothetical protein